MKNNFVIIIETLHLPDNGEQLNVSEIYLIHIYWCLVVFSFSFVLFYCLNSYPAAFDLWLPLVDVLRGLTVSLFKWCLDVPYQYLCVNQCKNKQQTKNRPLWLWLIGNSNDIDGIDCSTYECMIDDKPNLESWLYEREFFYLYWIATCWRCGRSTKREWKFLLQSQEINEKHILNSQQRKVSIPVKDFFE